MPKATPKTGSSVDSIKPESVNCEYLNSVFRAFGLSCADVIAIMKTTSPKKPIPDFGLEWE